MTEREIRDLKREKKKVETLMASQQKGKALLSKHLNKAQSPSVNQNFLTRSRTTTKTALTKSRETSAEPSNIKTSKSKTNQSKPAVRAQTSTRNPSAGNSSFKTTVPSRSHKKAGFVEPLGSAKSTTDVQNELYKLFVEFSEKLKNKGLLPEKSEFQSTENTKQYYQRKSRESYEKLLTTVGLTSSSELKEIVIQKIDLSNEAKNL